MAIPLSLLVITKNSRLGNNVVFTAGVLVGIGMEVLVGIGMEVLVGIGMEVLVGIGMEVLVGIGMEVLVISFFVCEEVVELSWEQADAMNSNMMITNVDFIIK